MRIVENKIYFSYVLLGSLYLISKLLFYIPGWVCTKGVILGLVATALTVPIGIFAFKEAEKTGRSAAHWLAVLLPLIILPVTPNYMIHKIYLGFKMFNPEKIIIFGIFEGLAFAQVILAVLMLRNLKGGERYGNK